MSTEPLLTVRDVAARVGLSEWAVRRAIHAGQLAAYKPRGRLRIAEADLETWLQGTRVVPAAGETPIPRASIRRQRTADLTSFELSA